MKSIQKDLFNAESQLIMNEFLAAKYLAYYFDRKTTPSITLWPTPENSTDTLVFYYVRRIQDVDTQVNTTDAPFRFLPCVIAGLSYYLAVKKAPDRIQLLKSIYEEEFQRASDEDDDRVPLKLTPDIKFLRV